MEPDPRADAVDPAPPPATAPAGHRRLRLAALALIVLSQLYLLLHSQEPLRLNVGDPWSDANVLSSLPYVEKYGFLKTSFTDILDVGPLTQESYRYTHYPPLAEITYGAAHKYLGLDAIGSFRLIAIGFSALALWMFFQYTRRLYDPVIALLATMLWSTNLLWLMYADSIHQAPIMQAWAFVGLWGLIRALDDPRPRYWAAAWVGSFGCFLTSYDYWLFLPAAVLVTVYSRRGNPFRRPNFRPVLLCASGCVAAIVMKSLFVIGAIGWQEFLRDLHFQFLERSTNKYEQHLSLTPSIIRRATMVFSPLIWIPVVIHGVRTLRARSFAAFVRDGAAWMLVTALLFFLAFSQLAASQMLATQVALPFFTVGTAMLAVQWLRGSRRAQAGALALLLVPPLWSAALLHGHQRSFLAAGDIAKVNAYLDAHDSNDFLVSNLLADGPIQAYFGRHYWPASASGNYGTPHLDALDLMAKSGRDRYHALIFTEPTSRMIDKSLWPLAAPGGQWSLTGWPFLFRAKGEARIRAYDKLVVRNLDEMGARVVLSTPTFDLYEVTRDRVMARAVERVRADRQFLDFGSTTTVHYLLLGWGGPRWLPDDVVAGWDVLGHEVCAMPGDRSCRTVLTKRGVVNRGLELRPEGEFMLRTSSGCDVELTIVLAEPGTIAVRLNGAAPISATLDGTRYVARFGKDAVVDGVSVFAVRVPMFPLKMVRRRLGAVPLASAELRRVCEAAPP